MTCISVNFLSFNLFLTLSKTNLIIWSLKLISLIDLFHNHVTDSFSCFVINQRNAWQNSPVVMLSFVVPKPQRWYPQSVWISSILSHPSEWLILLVLSRSLYLQINPKLRNFFLLVFLFNRFNRYSSFICSYKVFQCLRCWRRIPFSSLDIFLSSSFGSLDDPFSNCFWLFLF